MTTHIIRYDDFSACSSTEVETKLVNLLLKHRIPCTFSVIPFVCDPESLLMGGSAGGEIILRPMQKSKADLLKPLLEEGLAEIALHGYSHLAMSSTRGHQEFSWRMPKETQRRLILRGRDLLEEVFGARVRLYCPPWNNLSSATMAVLLEEGFHLCSEISNNPDSDSFGSPQCPRICGIAETSDALATADWFSVNNGVATVIHDYDFHESNFGASQLDIAQFEHLLIEWKNMKDVKHSLASDAILEKMEKEAAGFEPVLP